ncbi:MAG: UbiA family prenyltransferase [Pirellulaceae bacterium]
MTSTTDRATLRDWCQLVRLPNVFTVLADTTAAFLLVAQELDPVARYVLVIASVVFLYWSGMILNDLWDLEVDRRERPGRPLPAGRIQVAAARRAGWGLLLFGILLAGLAGYFPVEGVGGGFLPAGVAILLAISVVLYDGPVKRTPFAPIMMGACRFFSFLLGASAAMTAVGAFPFFSNHVLIIAAGFGIYIGGVTLMARGEAVGGERLPLISGFAVTIIGLAIIAAGPQFADGGIVFRIEPQRQFPLLIGLLAFTIIHRAMRAVADPQPRAIQLNIKHAILTLIPLSAAVSLLSAGPVAGLLVFALAVPAMTLGSFLRVT